ncbi:MAG: hypothetical protein PHF37_06480 [Phycisphaerae bacterium]|nr:hypothetical protein [Phycisphaerae bacterium]
MWLLREEGAGGTGYRSEGIAEGGRFAVGYGGHNIWVRFVRVDFGDSGNSDAEGGG